MPGDTPWSTPKPADYSGRYNPAGNHDAGVQHVPGGLSQGDEGLSDADAAKARKGKRIVQTPSGGFTVVDDE